ncbi:MAG TPA: ABC transporter ATP-binding protein, partial [Porphyromonadaceae bacterium]|nr:ABC transporter ATP-binding protein [Porphyromonadaceae bacterium]
QLEFYSFADQREVTEMLASMQLPAQQFNCETMNLEDIFIGLTGKY